MSLRPRSIDPIPEETARIARSAFPKGNPYLRLRDEVGLFYQDQDFAALFPTRGQPVLPPWRLALVTVMRFMESLSDRQAADAVRARIDWKYTLSLELSDPGFDRSVLREFRTRLVAGKAEQLLLDRMLERFREQGLVKARGRQRTDSTHVLASIRVLNRLELIGETLRAALNTLAAVAPEWIQNVAPPEWYARYAQRIEDSRLPRGQAAREALASTIGADGFLLLAALQQDPAAAALRSLPTIEVLRHVWARHFQCPPQGRPPTGEVRLKTERELSRAAKALESPYDPDARFRSKSGTHWTGYMVYLSETCDAGEVHLVTHVDTTPATVHEAMRTAAIHEALQKKELLPGEHPVDAGYVSTDVLVSGRERHGLAVLGPPRGNATWQARTEGAYTAETFRVDWQSQRAVCPQGKESVEWRQGRRRTGEPYSVARFAATDCTGCSARALCTRAKAAPRQLFLEAQAQHEALQAMRSHISSEEGTALYAKRAGVEGTISQGVRGFGLRQSRYRGLQKTQLRHVATAAAINRTRVGAWLDGQPHAATRRSRFARIAA